MFKSVNFLRLIGSILLCQAAGAIGSIFTASAIPNWYQTLTKPEFTPPGWLFGPAWITLYTLMGIAFYLVWQKGFKNNLARKAKAAFIIQLTLNALWSIIFFGLQSPTLALIEILLLLIAIIFTIYYFYQISKPAAYLLVPYLLWTSFATILNYSIVTLN